MVSTLMSMWLHLFGPDREEKMATAFLFAVGFGLTIASLIGYNANMNPRARKCYARPSEDVIDGRGSGSPQLNPFRLLQHKTEPRQRIIGLALFVSFVGFITFILFSMKFTAEDRPSAIYLGIAIMILSEVAKTVWPVSVRYGEWKHKQFRVDTPVVYRMKQAQSLLFCFLSAVEFFSPIPDELITSISVKLLHITSALIMVLALAQFTCRWIYKPVVTTPSRMQLLTRSTSEPTTTSPPSRLQVLTNSPSQPTTTSSPSTQASGPRLRPLTNAPPPSLENAATSLSDGEGSGSKEE